MTQTWSAAGYAHHAGFVSELGGPLLERLAPVAGERILDLGCGDGTLTARLVDRGARVIGVDASPDMVTAARVRGLDVRLADATTLAFDGAFDAVFSNAVLHWIHDADAVLAGVYRALAPGGRFVAEFGGHGCIAAVATALRAVLDRHAIRYAWPWYYPSADEYAARLEAAGFVVEFISLFPRPTPLPTGMTGWLDTFGVALFSHAPAEQRMSIRDEVVALLEPALCDKAGQWTADYVRLQVVAREAVLTAIIVAIRIFANPIANVFQKRLTQRSANPLAVIGATHALLTLAVLPFAVRVPWSSFGGWFWGDMAVSAGLAVMGNVLLVAALRSTDLSILGPINSYKAVVSLALGVVLLGEIPNGWGAVGVLLTVAGSALVVDREPGQARRNAFGRFVRDPGVRLRFAALVCSATEAVFLKRAILHSSPVTALYAWVVLGVTVAALACAALLRAEVAPQLRLARRDWLTYVWLALATGVMQLTTLLAFGVLQVGYSLALFQLSTVVSVALGAHFFAEENIRRRLVGAAVMMAGAALIVTIGR